MRRPCQSAGTAASRSNQTPCMKPAGLLVVPGRRTTAGKTVGFSVHFPPGWAPGSSTYCVFHSPASATAGRPAGPAYTGGGFVCENTLSCAPAATASATQAVAHIGCSNRLFIPFPFA